MTLLASVVLEVLAGLSYGVVLSHPFITTCAVMELRVEDQWLSMPVILSLLVAAVAAVETTVAPVGSPTSLVQGL